MSELDHEERCGLLHLHEIAQTFANSAGEIWSTGFRPDLEPIVLFRRDAVHSALGINLPPDAGGVPLTTLPEHLRHLRVTRLDLPEAAGLRLDLDLDLDARDVRLDVEVCGRQVLVLSIDSRDVCVTTHEFSRLLVHEAFHMHQLYTEQWCSPSGFDPNTPFRIDLVDAELATTELDLIEAAARCGDRRDSIALTREFLELRRTRHDRRPDLVALERGSEQVEGSARFVENQYARVQGRTRRLAPPDGMTTEDYLQFGRLYRTGARACELLDRFEIDWRGRLATGDDPVSILAEVIEAGRAGSLAETG